MNNQQHPITPPPELVEEWIAQVWHEGTPVRVGASDIHIATQAARWGADRELDECCEWCADGSMVLAQELRAAMRPKPPSLAEEAAKQLAQMEQHGALDCNVATIRAALDRLKELEQQENND